MGMYNDHVSMGRTKWTYKYKGSELVGPATSLYKRYRSEEESARNEIASLMKDMRVSNNDNRMDQLKIKINDVGTLKEQCLVFKHEFARNPEKEFELGLGDVTFFGLAGE